MKKLSLTPALLLLLFIPLTAQEETSGNPVAIESLVTAHADYFMIESKELPKGGYATEWYKHPSVKTFRFTAKDKADINKNGTVVGYNQYGDTQFISNYQRNQLYGEWRSWYHSRVPCDSGKLVKNVPDGEWKGWYPNGQLKFVYHFNARKLAALKDELRRQPKTKFFAIANKPPEVAAQYYNAGRIFGHKTEQQRSLFLSKQINHTPHSAVMLKNLVDFNTSPDDSINYMPPFTEGLLHGDYIEFFENGSIKKNGIYLNGLREGMWEEFSANGIKAVGTYRHGYPHGEWRYYDQKGKLLRWKRFDTKGRLSESFEFEKNKGEGLISGS